MAKKRTIRTIPQQRTPAREQDPRERARNFAEVSHGYDTDDAVRESERCLFCEDPKCIAGCPVGIDIPSFIRKIGERDGRGAYAVIRETSMLPAICGRVCPQENQCEGVCTVGEGDLEPVAIGRLERWVGDRAIAEGWFEVPPIERNRFRVGVVGAGPAGMACAADLARAGCEVIVYEAFHRPGGVLRYGIPDFRLPNDVIDAEIKNLEALGVKFECNTLVGRLFTIEQMVGELGFHAVFIGTGAGYPRLLGIPGDSLNGVLSANELLTRCNLMRAREGGHDTPMPMGHKVVVVGSGNTAMDALRVCVRLGADDVACVYRRTRAESPARAEELHHAEEEGITFHWLTHPVEVLGDERGNVRGLRCVTMTLGEPDASGRRAPVPMPGSEHEIACDLVVFAIGTNANPIIGQTSRLALDKRGYLACDDTLATSIAGVWAGGDIVTGAATVIEAMGAGRRAAAAMKRYLGLRDTDVVYRAAPVDPAARAFGLDPDERGYARLHLR
jgi:glutamate synthase (NADPH/NADH) small chain